MLLHSGASLHGYGHSREYKPTITTPVASTEHEHEAFVEYELESEALALKSRPLSIQSYIPGFIYMSSLLSPPRSFIGSSDTDFFTQKQHGSAVHRSETQTRQIEAMTPAAPRGSVNSDTESLDAAGLIALPSGLEEKSLRRPVARFALCQTPVTRRIPFRRSRNLLQLRRADRTHVLPALDVHLASHLPDAVHHTKLGRCLPKLFGNKLDANDIVIMRSAYDTDASFLGPRKDIDESHKHLDLLAAICPFGEAGDRGVDIALDDGSIWVGRWKSNGSFELVTEDVYGDRRAVRWIPRTSKSGENYFNFCVVDSQAKSWPIQGVLKRGSLDVYGTYTTVTSTTRSLSSQSVSFPQISSQRTDPTRRPRSTCTVTEYDQRLMTLTAIWVSFCQNDWPGALQQVKSGCPISRTSLPQQSANRSRSKSESMSGSESSILGSRSTDGVSSICGSDRMGLGSGKLARRASAGAAYMQRRRSTKGPIPMKKELEIKGPQQAAGKSPGCQSKLRKLAHKVLH